MSIRLATAIVLCVLLAAVIAALLAADPQPSVPLVPDLARGR